MLLNNKCLYILMLAFQGDANKICCFVVSIANYSKHFTFSIVTFCLELWQCKQIRVLWQKYCVQFDKYNYTFNHSLENYLHIMFPLKIRRCVMISNETTLSTMFQITWIYKKFYVSTSLYMAFNNETICTVYWAIYIKLIAQHKKCETWLW